MRCVYEWEYIKPLVASGYRIQILMFRGIWQYTIVEARNRCNALPNSLLPTIPDEENDNQPNNFKHTYCTVEDIEDKARSPPSSTQQKGGYPKVSHRNKERNRIGVRHLQQPTFRSMCNTHGIREMTTGSYIIKH